MSDEVGSVALGLELTGTKLESQLNGMIGGVAKKAASMLAAVFSFKALTDFGKECIELGSNLSEVQNVVDVTFPSMSAKADEFAQSAAATFGLSETMAKKFTGAFGSMAEAFGFSEEAAYAMSTSLTGLAGDVASFYNITQDEAYTKLKSVFSGETETLKDLGVVMTQTALDAYALANGYGKTTSAMTEAEKVSLRYAFVQDQLANATGDFYRTQDSWANQSRMLSLQAQSAMAAVGQGLISLLRPALVALNRVMAKIVQLAGAFRDLMALLFGDAGSSTGSATSTVASDLGAASSNADALTSGLNSAASAAKDLQRQVMGFDQIDKLSDTGASSFGGGTSSGGTAGLDATVLSDVSAQADKAMDSVGALGNVISQVKSWWAGIDFSPLQTAWDTLGTRLGEVGDTLSGSLYWGLTNVLEPLAEWTIEEALPAVLDTLSAALDLLDTVITDAEPAFQWLWDHFLDPIAEWAGDTFIQALKEIKDLLQDLNDLLEGNTTFSDFVANLTPAQTVLLGIAGGLLAINAASGAITVLNGVSTSISAIKTLNATGLFGKLAEVILLTASGAGTLSESMSVVFGTIGTAIAGIGAIIGGAILAVTNFVSMFVNGFDAVKEVLMIAGIALAAVGAIILGAPAFVAGVIAGIVAAIATAVVLVKEHLEEIKMFFTNLWEGIKAVFSTVANWFKTVFSNAWTAIKKVFNPVKSFFTGIWNTIKNLFTSIGTAVGDAISGAVKKAINTVISKAYSIINTFIGAINTVIGVINAIPGVDIKKISKLTVPKLAEGGYVGANRPQLAVIGDNRREGEIVAPESKLADMAAQAAQAVSAQMQNVLPHMPLAVKVDAQALARRSTPVLAGMRGSTASSHSAEAVSAGVSSSYGEKLLEAVTLIYQWMQEREPVTIDPDALYHYFVQAHNRAVKQTGRSELYI